MNVEIVTIGDELLLGFTVDTNAAYLARLFGEIGVAIPWRTTVGDNASAIADAVRAALDRTGAVITTGGLGPTSDDLTKPAIAELFGREMYHEEAVADAIRARWARLRRTGKIPESNFTQALVPRGADILPNDQGTAPGLWLEDEQGRWVAMLPGVPREMRAMLERAVIPRVVARRPANEKEVVIRSRTIRSTGIPESTLFDRLGSLATNVEGLSPAYLPGIEGVDVRLTSQGRTAADADGVLDKAAREIRNALGPYAYGEDNDDLAAKVLDLCRSRGLKLAVAESCTGGLLGERITAIPGSSDVFVGGVIAYDNAVKVSFLGVPTALIDRHGAVSGEVATAMAKGIVDSLGTDVGVAITGVAGPGGGTEEKPIGLVWIAIQGVINECRQLRLFGDRREVRQRAAQAALDMVRRGLG
ncbi:MAG TPA: competence/damage-inducible protein A [Gemmatimonadaceae bacterium]|jgi:nicotinamide-nucleotide amidase